MTTTLNDKMKKLSGARRKKIDARAAQLIAEEMSLRDLRKARRLTQERIAEVLNLGQDGISRLEKRSDLLISTLRNYVEAMGGSLSLVAEFPDRQPVILAGLAAVDSGPSSTLRQENGRSNKLGRNASRRVIHWKQDADHHTP
jgi:transcriptional regulator with XRE-family HTH domain